MWQFSIKIGNSRKYLKNKEKVDEGVDIEGEIKEYFKLSFHSNYTM
jgi:hypothetical protein